MTSFDDDQDDFPMFLNLRSLLLDDCDVGAECQVLRGFLGNSPSLETLVLRNCVFGTDSCSKKRKASSSPEKTSSAAGWHGRTAYDCNNLKSIELEFADGSAVDELADTLLGISKEIVQPIQASVHDGMRRVKISFA
ncbi:hypothetical protein U9M48_001321 [Paspalum notatum var. saurae]|uniref:F-box protein n=1 Tax=Paspalum notatum var. saurae TaxID=547442 RepID=A0AAQ3PG81_PASNO